MKEKSNKKIRVAFYLRVSTEHESQISALENQIDWCDNLLDKYTDWEVVERYIDKGITGTQAKKRPQFLKMIADAKKGNFDLIVTREVSRFARNTLDTLTYTRELTANNIEVFFVTDGIRTFDPDGESRLTNMAAFAQDESRKTSVRVKAGQEIARKKNVLYGSGNILGYNRSGNTFIIDEEQAETVKMIFKLYIEGNGLKLIKAELLKEGRKNSKGKVKWFESTLSRMLSNPMYVGKQYQNQTCVTNYLEHIIKKNNKSDYVTIDGKFKPIISVEDFEKVAETKKSRCMKNPGQKPYGVKTSNDKWMNLLECGCGSKFQAFKWSKYKLTGEVKKGYSCRNRVVNNTTKYRIDNDLPLDGACDKKTISDWHLDLMVKDILEQIWEFRKESVIKAFELIKDNWVYDEDDNANKIKELNAKIETFKQKSRKHLELYNGNYITLEEFTGPREEYNKHIKEAEDELKQTEGGLDLAENNLEIKLQHIKKTLEQLIDFDVEKLDDDIINQLVDKVIARDDKTFEWFLNISDIETEDLFNSRLSEKLEIKIEKSIEVRDTKYTLAFDSIISVDRAKAYRKQYNKYILENKWTDIKYGVYVR